MAVQMQRPHNSGRRRSSTSTELCFSVRSLLVFLFFSSIISATLAYDMELDERTYDSRQFKRLARMGQIAIDQRQQPPLPVKRLGRRQEESSSAPATQDVLSTSFSSSLISTLAPSSSTTSASSTAVTSELSTPKSGTPTTHTNIPSATVITTPIPVPFDTSLGSNFTSQSCPDFFNTFLNNATFKSCSPVSLLLQNSNSFFQAERDPTLLSETLEIACNAPLAICSPLMTSIAGQLISDSNCGSDYSRQNPLVSQAYNGLRAYEPLYRATCLKNPDTGSFCFTDAITNSSNSANAYPYYTALGLYLPIGSRPTCDKCLQDTMDVFATYATESDQPVSVTYTSSAYEIDLACGADFVNTTVPVAVINGASGAWRSNMGLLAAGLIMMTLAL